MIDRLEVLNRHVTGNCSAILADGDAAVVAQLCKELKHPQVGRRHAGRGKGLGPSWCTQQAASHAERVQTQRAAGALGAACVRAGCRARCRLLQPALLLC